MGKPQSKATPNIASGLRGTFLLAPTAPVVLSSPSDRFGVGDQVLFETDVKRAEKFQAEIEGWNEQLRMYLGKPCTIIKIRNDEQVDVQFEDERKITVIAFLLTKINKVTSGKTGAIFKPYDLVTIDSKRPIGRGTKQQEDSFEERIKRFAHMKGIVRSIEDETVQVEFVPQILLAVDSSRLISAGAAYKEIEKGDIVLIPPDLDLTEYKRRNGSKIEKAIKKVLGALASVTDLEDSEATLQVAGDKYTMNTTSLRLVNKSEDYVEFANYYVHN